ncbi:MAG: TetR/AcrR family transcriptional regulator [Desulfobacterales bacterium]|nr:TetR/AcrR family transcriptional regulator [Desulfobacterales bacterium]
MKISSNNNKDVLTDIKKRILEESIRLFASKGFDGTSIQQIADAVGIKKPSLIYHFNSKDELRQQVYEYLLGHWKEELPKLLSSASNEYDRFSSVVRALVEYFLENSNRSRLAIREMLDRPEYFKSLVKQHLSPWVKLVTDYIQLGKKLGLVKKDVDPEAYIVNVIMMAIGTVSVGNVISSIFEKENTDYIGPLTNELERIARYSLLQNPFPNQKMEDKNEY